MRWILLVILWCAPWIPWTSTRLYASERETVNALYIPLADHYAALVAYETYRQRMVHADFRLQQMRSWPQLRGAFRDGAADLAFIISPMAMAMFAEQPDFRWVGLMHRDGNALVINAQLQADLPLPDDQRERRADDTAARALKRARQYLGHASVIGLPSLLSTHAVVLYKYLKDHGLSLGLGQDKSRDVLAIELPPAHSVDYIKRENLRNTPASFEQSLPWADMVETSGAGRIAWYSRDVLKSPNGHVDCIAIVPDRVIGAKPAAIMEVIHYIHRAARDIEAARRAGGAAMDAIVAMIRAHVPGHTREAIEQSLRIDLNVINYRQLNVDPSGLKQVMDLAIEAGILKSSIDIDAFADPRFATHLTDPEAADPDPDELENHIRQHFPPGAAP